MSANLCQCKFCKINGVYEYFLLNVPVYLLLVLYCLLFLDLHYKFRLSSAETLFIQKHEAFGV